VALVVKNMKPRLHLQQLRTKPPTRVEATVRALLVAWALHEGTTTLLRTLLSTTATAEISVVSSWQLSGLGLDTLRQQVQGPWSAAQVQVCWPRLRRFLGRRPRHRVHPESAVRAWLVQQPHTPKAGRQVA
jgi:hypothetical protein